MFSLTAYNEALGEDSVRVLLLVQTPPLPARDAIPADVGKESSTISSKPTGLRMEESRQRNEIMLHWEEPVPVPAYPMTSRPLYYIVQ